ncbi:MAG: hypothetical protein AAFV38_04085 [Pseudomonadota bacterium]
MDLRELAPVPTAALPLAGFKEHLRLGSGFADTGAEDALLERYLRAAIAEVESLSGKALLVRSFQTWIEDWSLARLPLAPVGQILRVAAVTADGEVADLDPADFLLWADRHRPKVMTVSALPPRIPAGGALLLEIEAGFGANWDDVPPELALAVMQIGARHFEDRTATELDTIVAANNIARLLRPWKAMSLGAVRGAGR